MVRLLGDNKLFRQAMKEGQSDTANLSRAVTVGAAAGAAAIFAFGKKSMDTYVDTGKAIMKLSRMTGENIEVTSKMAYAGKMAGLDYETFSNGIKFLSKNMEAGNPAFVKLGVNVRGAGGELRSTHDVLLDTADALSKMANGAEKTALIQQIFGRGGQAMGKLMNEGRAGILAAEEEAKKYGVVLSQDNVEAISKSIEAHRHLDAAVQGLQLRLGSELLPTLTSVTEFFATLPGPIMDNIGPITLLAGGLSAVVFLGPRVKAGFEMIGEGATVMDAAISGAALGGIVVLLGYMNKVEDKAKEMQTQLSGSIDFTNRASAGNAVDAEGRAVDELGKKWNNMNAIERAADMGQTWAVYSAAAAQYAEDLKHVTAQDDRLRQLGMDLGISAQAAQMLTDAMHFDPTQADPSKYTAILRDFTSGTIDAATAQARLQALMRETEGTTEDAALAQWALGSAQKEATSANRAAEDAQDRLNQVNRQGADLDRQHAANARALADAQRAVADVQDRINHVPRDKEQAQLDLRDAMLSVGEAQDRLNKATPAERARAEIELERAKLRVADAQDAVTKADGEGAQLAQDLADAQDKVKDAQRAIADEAPAQLKLVQDRQRAEEDLTAALDGQRLALYALTDQQLRMNDAVAAGVGIAQGAGIPPATVVPNFGPGSPHPNGPHGDNSYLFAAHAAGGMLDEGWNLVGELGPELAYKRGRDVSVRTAAQSRPFLVPAGASHHGPGSSANRGGVVVHEHNHFDGIPIDTQLEAHRRRQHNTLSVLAG